MGIMNRMRENTAVVLYILVFAFGGLWVLQDSGAFEAVGFGMGRDIARVNGEAISMQDFQGAVSQRTQLYQQQGIEITPALQARIEDEVFDALVENRLREAEMDRLGVGVSDAEVREAIVGENPDPIIRQLFGDGQGGVDRVRLNDFIANPDPAAQEQLIQLEELVRQNRRQAKLDALIAATARVSEAEVEAEWVRRNRRASAEYVALRYADVPDAEVEVAERDLRAFYDENREDFERPASYTVQYVTFPKVPSEEDSVRVRTALERVEPEFAAAEEPGAFVQTNAYGSGEVETVTPADLHPELASAVFADLTPGRVAGPVLAGEEGTLVRIVGAEPAARPAVRARHILFPSTDEALAREVKTRIEDGDFSFEAAAALYSQDESNKHDGGDLGWFGPGRMVAAFETAALSAPVGQVVGPVETQFGWHLLRVDEKSTQQAEIVRLSVPLQSTYDRLLEQAEDLQYYADAEGTGFAEEAQRRGLNVQSAVVLDDEPLVPGLQLGRDAVRWMRTARPGAISEPFDAGASFVVFELTETTPEGYTPFEEVRSQLEPRVRLEKKRAVQASRMRDALAQAGGDLTALASALGQSVQPLENLAMNAPAIPGLGREPRVVGTVFGLDTGAVSGPIEGESAVFVVRPTGFQGGDLAQFTDAERQQIRQQLLQRKRAQVQRAWIEGLREEAKIEDFRNTLL